MRELFIEELSDVRGGSQGGSCCPATTEACCEEGPLDGCCGWWLDRLEDIIKP